MVSLSEQPAAAASAAGSAASDASITTRWLRSVQNNPKATASTSAATLSLNRACVCLSACLRMEPPLSEVIDQVRDRQDRKQPDQQIRNSSRDGLRKHRSEPTRNKADEERYPEAPVGDHGA